MKTQSKSGIVTALCGVVFALHVVTAAAQTPVGQTHPVVGPGVFTVFERAFAAHGVARDKHIAFINEACYAYF